MASQKFAIVTGASTGIGFELAHLAAQDGYDLLVVADEPLIHAAADDFRRHGVDVQAVESDLSTMEGVDRLITCTGGRRVDLLCANAGRRSEEHTSELQSLMRISYAVFCLKKKTTVEQHSVIT